VIPTDGSPHPADPDPTWMGDSIGRWEGDTLVVDAIAFNDRTELPGGYRHTEALHVVERFHRIDFDHLQWDATIEDPSVFTKPWILSRTFALRGIWKRWTSTSARTIGIIRISSESERLHAGRLRRCAHGKPKVGSLRSAFLVSNCIIGPSLIQAR